MPAPKGNDFSSKPANERAESWLQVRVRRSEKAAWVKAAQREGKNLSQWATDTLNRNT
jgi:predicted HicB family RNase H-like nuclease